MHHRNNGPDDSRLVITIERLLSEVIELQKNYVARICPRCLAPCCSRVSYLFCEKDILFLRLSGRNPEWRREQSKNKGCRFLSPDGCRLDLKLRPFMCHRYICSDLEKEMKNDKPWLFLYLKEKINAVDHMRSQMWTEYLAERMK